MIFLPNESVYIKARIIDTNKLSVVVILGDNPGGEVLCIPLKYADMVVKREPIKTASNPSKIVSDDINHPSRYNCGGYECQDVIKAVTANLKGVEAVNTGHIIRYVWRWKQKQPIKSLKKIIYYCNDLINELEKQGYNENDE